MGTRNGRRACQGGDEGELYLYLVSSASMYYKLAMMFSHCYYRPFPLNLANGHKTSQKASRRNNKYKIICAPQYQYAKERYYNRLWYTVPYHLQTK